MFSPKHFSKITNDAVAKIEQERLLEEAKLKKLAEEAKALEEERLAREQAEMARRQEVKKLVPKVLQAAIEAALLGESSTTVYVPSALIHDVHEHFRCYDIRVTIAKDVIRPSKLRTRIQTLIGKVAQDYAPNAHSYKSRLTDLLDLTYDSDVSLFSDVSDIVHEMRNDQLGWFDDAVLYFNLQIKPLENDLWDSSQDSDSGRYMDITWMAKDARDHHFVDIEDAPSWLVSTSGLGLMQNINKCLSQSAKTGARDVNFVLVPTPMKAERWGSNQMTKVVSDTEPIGVFPFRPEVFAKMLKLVGFSANLSTHSSNQTLKIGW